MAFQFQNLDIEGLIYIEPDIFGDQRGFLAEIYKYPEFKKHGIMKPFVQVNYSKSTKGTLRGLHYQKDPMAQGKLVSVVEGEIFDVGVDLREGSPTYGKWVGLTLNAEKKNMLYIPEGFAHGFCVLSETAQLIYYCTQVYSPEHERGIIWNDKELDIAWPIENPILSDRDKDLQLLNQTDNNFSYKTQMEVNHGKE